MKAIPCARYRRYMALFETNCKERQGGAPNLSRRSGPVDHRTIRQAIGLSYFFQCANVAFALASAADPDSDRRRMP